MQINEIFASVDGEVNQLGQGFPTIFIRTQGCNLKCTYCDTRQSWSPDGGKSMLVDDIVGIVCKSGFSKVTITGGEPLLQEDFPELCEKLINRSIMVSVETNGTCNIPDTETPMLWSWMKNVDWIVDYKLDALELTPEIFVSKLPSFGWIGRIKMVIGSYTKFLKSLKVMDEISELLLQKNAKSPPNYFFALSPMHDDVSPEELFSWMAKERFNHPILMKKTSINIQLHKIIFPKGEKNYLFG
jgi:7-carboxy-7-deazaguanine synthase